MEERANIVEDKIVIPGRELNNFDKIGYTWDDLIPLFKKFLGCFLVIQKLEIFNTRP